MKKIKNLENLASTPLRKAALLIAEAGLEAIETKKIIKDKVRLEGDELIVKENKFKLEKSGKLFVVGIGKCANEAAYALQEILGEKIDGGIVLGINSEFVLEKIKNYEGSHPLPSDENVKAAGELVSFLKNLSEDDFVIFIISGGGSTLLCLPRDKSCENEAKIIHTLMDAGADIQEINTVRKHLSLARAGFLAQYTFPARGVSLIFSDVPGNEIQFVASGPTVKDKTTVADAEKILSKYDIPNRPDIQLNLIETPKEEKFFKNIKNIVVVSNIDAVRAMTLKAEELGFKAEARTICLQGETNTMAKKIATELKKADSKSALLYGGETTLIVHGGGKGGRNMEFALRALHDLPENSLILTLASDGRDNSDFAGAICDKITKEKASSLKLDILEYLDTNNEYPFFQAVGDYILTGPTGSNVSDLIIAIKQ